MDGNQSMEGIGDIAMSLASDLSSQYGSRPEIARVKRQYNYRVKTGRPAAYKKVYCQMLVDFCSNGYSLTAFAGSIRVARSCLLRWADQYPEFRAAIEIAKGARAECLEREALESDNSAKINYRVAALKNTAPEDWRDTQAIEITQNVNVAVTFSTTLDGLCATVIDGVLEGERVTQSNDINELQHSTTDIEAIGAIPPMYIEHSRGANEGASEPPLVAKEPQPVAVDTAPSTNSKKSKRKK